jgi:hypothetical protein
MPFSNDKCACSMSLKKSYETSWEAFIRTARTWRQSCLYRTHGIRGQTPRQTGRSFFPDHPIDALYRVAIVDPCLFGFCWVRDHPAISELGSRRTERE